MMAISVPRRVTYRAALSRSLIAVVVACAWGVPVPQAVAANPAKHAAAQGTSVPQPPAKQPDKGDAASAALDDLLARFAKAPGIFARFREEKHLALLDAPLVNEGTIHFAPPARLARHTERPLASTVLIDGGQLKFGDAEGHQSLDLGANPVARAFVDSFLLLLAGDKAGLERQFTMRFDQGVHKVSGPSKATDGSAWKLTLVPRQAPMNKIMKELSLRGQGLVIEEMEMHETSGDWSRTLFSDVDVKHVYSPAEQGRVFRIPGR